MPPLENPKYTPENKDMVDNDKKTEITTLKRHEKATKGQKKMFWLGQKKFGKRFQKSEKTAFLTTQKKLETQSGSYDCFSLTVTFSCAPNQFNKIKQLFFSCKFYN